MGGMIYWQDVAIPFRAGETVASALARGGVTGLGVSVGGMGRGVFCGIGQCQNCLVMHAGRPVEACLLMCHDGMHVQPQQGGAR